MSFRYVTAILITGLCGLVPYATGDTLYMKGGDVLSGKFETLTQDAAGFVTTYAGTLTIVRAEIQLIETDAALPVRLANGESLTGRFLVTDGVQRIETSDGVAPIALEDITVVGPEAAAAAPAASDDQPPSRRFLANWQGSWDAGTSWQSGNTDSLDASTAIQLKRAWKKDTVTLKLGGAYRETDSEVTTRSAKSESKWQHYANARLYWYGLAGAEHDAGRRLDLRLGVGSGAGYDFIASEKRTLSAETGIEYTRSEWTQYTPSERDDAKHRIRDAAWSQLRNLSVTSIEDLAAAWDAWRDIEDPLRNEEKWNDEDWELRLSVRGSQTLLDKVTIADDLTVWPTIDDWSQYRLTNEFSILTPLLDRISLKLSWKTDYDTTTDDGDIRDWDHKITSALRYEF